MGTKTNQAEQGRIKQIPINESAQIRPSYLTVWLSKKPNILDLAAGQIFTDLGAMDSPAARVLRKWIDGQPLPGNGRLRSNVILLAVTYWRLLGALRDDCPTATSRQAEAADSEQEEGHEPTDDPEPPVARGRILIRKIPMPAIELPVAEQDKILGLVPAIATRSFLRSLDPAFALELVRLVPPAVTRPVKGGKPAPFGNLLSGFLARTSLGNRPIRVLEVARGQPCNLGIRGIVLPGIALLDGLISREIRAEAVRNSPSEEVAMAISGLCLRSVRRIRKGHAP